MPFVHVFPESLVFLRIPTKSLEFLLGVIQCIIEKNLSIKESKNQKKREERQNLMLWAICEIHVIIRGLKPLFIFHLALLVINLFLGIAPLYKEFIYISSRDKERGIGITLLTDRPG